MLCSIKKQTIPAVLTTNSNATHLDGVFLLSTSAMKSTTVRTGQTKRIVMVRFIQFMIINNPFSIRHG